jgi:hypothetical protein
VTAIAVVAGPEDPRMTLDPIHQFNINNLFKIGQIGDHAIYFTNSSAYMLLTVAVICLLAAASKACNWFPAVSRRWPN